MPSQDDVIPPVDHGRPVLKDPATIQLQEEEWSISRREVETSTARVETVTHSRDRLLLREEVHIRRVRTTEHLLETVKLRKQEAVITCVPVGADGRGTIHPTNYNPGD